MASKELRKLKRRELLKMLLVQCQETERLQMELNEITSEHDAMMESYERLKGKLNVKDERLNQKDMKIRELQNTIEEMRTSRAIELEDAGSIAEAALRLNGVFEAAQRAAEQYLMNVRKLSEDSPKIPEILEEEKSIPIEAGWRAGIRRKGSAPRIRQMTPQMSVRANPEAGTAKDGAGRGMYAAASGDTNG